MGELSSNAYIEAEIESAVRKFPLVPDKALRFGRSEGNTVVLDDDLASRNHAILHGSDSGVFYLTDLGSTNGTLVNGSRVTAPVALRSGDRIQIGNHIFTFHQEIAQSKEPEVVVEKATNLSVSMRMISVLVVDIRDFTGLTQRLGAEKVGELAGTFFREGGQVLRECGAWAQKYIGDAVMAVWLHHEVHPHLEEISRVFEPLSGLVAVAGRLQDKFQLSAPIRIGAGVNTGPASIGNFGSVSASDYTALGDVVNKAFRLESTTKELGCDLLVGRDTYYFVGRSPAASRVLTPSVIKLKGYAEAETVYCAHWSSIEFLIGALREPCAAREAV